jgi:ABC-2 type transport system permease protein
MSKAPKKSKARSVSLGGKPGGIRWLMGHELRLFWRRGKVNPRTGVILLILLLGLWSTASFFIFMRLGPMIPPPPFDDGPAAGLALTVVDVVIAFMGSVMISGAILAAVEAIYTRNDLDLLLSSPISAWRILVVRASAIALRAMPLYAGMLGPPLLWMTIFSSPLWLSGIVVIITLAFMGTGFALLIVTGLFRLLGPKRTRVLAQIFSAIAGAAIFLSFQYFNVTTRGEGAMTPQQTAELIQRLNIQPDVWWLFPARAFTGDIVATLMWVLATAIVFPLGVYIFSRRFVADAAAASTMGTKKRVADTRIAAVRGGLTGSVIRKEMRLLVRDPLLLSQIGLQLLYFLPLGFVLLRPDPDGQFQLTAAAFAPALTLLAGALAGSLIWVTVSAEDAPDLIASAPVSLKAVHRAKIFAAVAPVLALMVLPVIALGARDLNVGLWAGLGVAANAMSAALVGVWRRTQASRKDFVRRRQSGSLITSLGKAFIGLGLTATVGAGAYGYPWLALIPAIITIAMLGALYKPTPRFAEA